ncbi:hypothetical protein [Desulfotomaculum sp. 1211_IL3151]|uniref:hypothetical protein n=1 Tax=Desulfotomaculum sp. 1211_IL3151 TaxID=3084055 RepID=UPI002FDA5FB2
MEKPILFNTEMVRVILAGKKTQTRRIIKNCIICDGNLVMKKWGIDDTVSPSKRIFGVSALPKHAPYQVGDILWVRETWVEYWHNGEFEHYRYKANGVHPEEHVNWKPSIHMTRDAARLFLKVTNVSVERLQDITEMDARAEGCFLPSYDIESGELVGSSTTLFKIVWDGVYGNWKDNPWVWVIEFEKI